MIFVQEKLMVGVVIAMFVLNCDRRQESNPVILMQTEIGDIVVELYLKRAPCTTENFLRYADEDRFVDASFYRVVRMDNQPNDNIMIEVVQGGLGFRESDLRLPPIAHETTEETGVLHKDGTLSMARAAPGTASSEFFICVGDQPALDYGGKRNPDGQGFAAFGRVVMGMDVVRSMHNMPAEGQMLVTPVRILGVRRKDKDFSSAVFGEKNEI
jgi:peptidyl-prolyl cis-trans isomerase A (cyclophilin A)